MRRSLFLLVCVVSVVPTIGVSVACEKSPSGCPNRIETDCQPETPAPPDKGTASSGVSREMLQAHVDHLLKFLNTQPKKDSPVDLAVVLEAGFAFAQTRLQPERFKL